MEERRDRLYRAEELSIIRESSIIRFKQIYESLPIDSLGRKIWNRAKGKSKEQLDELLGLITDLAEIK